MPKSLKLRALLIDLNGTLHIGTEPTPSAISALERLRKAQIPFIFCSNSTKESSANLLGKLKQMGFKADKEELLTSLGACKMLVEERGLERPLLLMSPSAKEEFSSLTFTGEDYDSVILGHHPDSLSYEPLNRAFRVLKGEPISSLSSSSHASRRPALIAPHASMYLQDPGSSSFPPGLSLGIGPFIRGLEEASGAKAEIIGKPTEGFFQLALEKLKDLSGKEFENGQVGVVGDDAENDLGQGAKHLGLQRILVKTGKYRQDVEETMEHPPDWVYETPPSASAAASAAMDGSPPTSLNGGLGRPASSSHYNVLPIPDTFNTTSTPYRWFNSHHCQYAAPISHQRCSSQSSHPSGSIVRTLPDKRLSESRSAFTAQSCNTLCTDQQALVEHPTVSVEFPTYPLITPTLSRDASDDMRFTCPDTRPSLTPLGHRLLCLSEQKLAFLEESSFDEGKALLKGVLVREAVRLAWTNVHEGSVSEMNDWHAKGAMGLEVYDEEDEEEDSGEKEWFEDIISSFGEEEVLCGEHEWAESSVSMPEDDFELNVEGMQAFTFPPPSLTCLPLDAIVSSHEHPDTDVNVVEVDDDESNTLDVVYLEESRPAQPFTATTLHFAPETPVIEPVPSPQLVPPSPLPLLSATTWDSLFSDQREYFTDFEEYVDDFSLPPPLLRTLSSSTASSEADDGEACKTPPLRSDELEFEEGDEREMERDVMAMGLKSEFASLVFSP
ncbi:TIGR01458 family HAD hydrolase [Cryptococcus depauperatus CBS 7841]|uniref:TIGR01458 family HAD hydrolase n=1 Tax=Cryptococcus depauperatus CBS 7841 TaxID=1295531 RepID=A0AAJ8LZN5_9TREE